MAISRLRIETNGSPLVMNWKFFLNEIDIGKYISKVEFSISTKGISEIKLTLPTCTPVIPDGFDAHVVIVE